jgi:hypothetical protein
VPLAWSPVVVPLGAERLFWFACVVDCCSGGALDGVVALGFAAGEAGFAAGLFCSAALVAPGLV